MSFMSSRQWALRETVRGIASNVGLFSFSTLLSALALSIPLFIACVGYGLSEPLRTLPTSVEITVFTAADAKVETLKKSIASVERVIRTEIVSREEAFQALNESLGARQQKNAANPLPDIVIATLAQDVSAAQTAAAAKAIEGIKGVDFVAYEAGWHEKFRSVTDAAVIGLACLGLVVFTLVILVLAAAIRMMTLSAKSEMLALHLFGASPAFAIRPYAWRGAVLMTASAFVALGLTQAGILIFGHAVSQAAALYETSIVLQLPALKWCALFVLGSAFCGAIVAALAAGDSWRKIR